MIKVLEAEIREHIRLVGNTKDCIIKMTPKQYKIITDRLQLCQEQGICKEFERLVKERNLKNQAKIQLPKKCCILL